MSPKYSFIFRQIEKISDDMAKLALVYRQPRIVVNLRNGKTEYTEKWINAEAEELYNQSIDSLLELRKMIEQETKKTTKLID